MNIIDFVDMSLVVDICLGALFSVMTWKVNKLNSNLDKIRADLNLTIRNPQAARREMRKRK